MIPGLIFRRAIASANGVELQTDDLIDTAILDSQIVVRGYQLWPKQGAVRVFDLLLDSYPIDHELEKYYEVEKPDAPILVFDRADADRVLMLSREHKYHGSHVFTINNFYYSDFRLTPGFIESLDPKTVQTVEPQLILAGELPILGNNLPLILTMLQQVGLDQNLHMTRQEYVNANRYKADDLQFLCFQFNCPICRHIEYTLERITLGEQQFKQKREWFFLGEPAFSERSRIGEEWMRIKEHRQKVEKLGLKAMKSFAMLDFVSHDQRIASKIQTIRDDKSLSAEQKDDKIIEVRQGSIVRLQELQQQYSELEKYLRELG